MRKIKIMHVLTTTAGGLGQSVLSLVRHLDPEKFDVMVVFGPGHPIDQWFIDAGLRVCPIRMTRELHWQNFLGFIDMYRLLKKEKVDIVHAHSAIAGLIARVAAKLAGVPIVMFTLHGYASLNHRHPVIRAILSPIEKLLDRCTDQYVAVSKYVKRVWCEQGIVADEQVTVIYHGTDPRRGSAATSRSTAQALNLPVGVPIIGTVGLLEVQKGTEFLLRAMPKITQVIPNCHCLIIGSGPLRKYLEDLAESLGVRQSVYFLGWRNDAAELIDLFDVFCLPSVHESFGLVLLEAMLHGKPIVATNVEGIPEVVVDGETGLLVPPCDSDALARAVIQCLSCSDSRREMGERGRVRLLNRYTSQVMVQQYEQLYQRAYQQRVCGERGA